ncbi:LacI family DNA-binding transcriptional regulator [Halioxenophilus aromaticivorans]|uniref:LacI family DNA-binding transcriptional regulator n=1 Tax=Halioxenophilus aromaticivorans TaxID=1306992 RepID=A0AAV3UAW5_9ALTE
MNRNNINKPATITDVARHAGVSIKTVSRVVNKEPNVSQATLDKVQTAIESLNYRPNMSARGLAAQRSFLITILYDTYLAHSSYTSNVQLGVLKHCNQAGYEVLIHPIEYDKATVSKRLEQHLKRTRPDGLIITPPVADAQNVHQVLNELGTPYVCLSPGGPQADNFVSIDDEKAAQDLCEYLLALGHSQFAVIVGHPDHIAMSAREKGIKKAMRAAGLPLGKHLQKIQGKNTFHSGVEATEKLLTQGNLPTAIIACNDEMAAGAIHVLHQHNIDVPSDVSVCGFDDAPIAEHTWPQLTTIRQPVHQMAFHAAELLVEKLAGNASPKSRIEFSSELIIRASSCAPKGL